MSKTPPRLSDDARDVLDAYRRQAPGPARRRANLEAVRARVDEESSPRAAAAAGLAWPIGWGMASAAVAAGLVWGLVSVRTPEPVREVPSVEAPSTVSEEPSRPAPARTVQQPKTEPPAEAEAPAPPAAPVQRPVPRERPSAASEPPAPSASALREETRLLRNVRSALAAEAWSEASEHLDAYTVAFPNGALREDAQAYRVVVRCKQGSDAQALRRSFVKRYPESPHLARIEAACGQEKE